MDVVEEIKRRLDPVDYIGRQVKLTRAGRNFRGLCPFHSEKTPSFYVFADRGTWRCFGSCGVGGDLFTFVAKRDGVDFKAALTQLAAEAGVQLVHESPERRSRIDRLGAVLSAGVDFYQRALEAPDGAAAREYLAATRGLRADAIADFNLGWAPDDWRALRDALTARGYDERDLVAAGLLVEPESGAQAPYDRFRGRVIVPIADERGVFVAMGGRGLAGEQPKYLNSPQTELFDKGRTLFAYHLAAPQIRASGTAVIVEGYMDVIGPWQAGFRNVVATMGTSLTEHHVALLKRSARRVVLAMDPDSAGLAAAERAGGLFLSPASPETAAESVRSAEALLGGTAIDLCVATLPPGQDPDEVARHSPDTWRAAIDGAIPFVEFLIGRLIPAGSITSPNEARQLVDKVRPLMLSVSDPVERGRYVSRIAQRLRVPEPFVFERIRPSGRPGARPAPPVRSGKPSGPEGLLLAILVRHPALRDQFAHLPGDELFTDSVDRQVFLSWRDGPGPDGPADAIAARRESLQRVLLPPLSEQMAGARALDLVRAIGRQRLEMHHVAVTEQLARAEEELGADAVAQVSHLAWRGVPAPAGDQGLAETVIEDLQLGLSIHRQEAAASG
ncbi:MAG: DNA primase [Dehalococcoidia bacterium]